MNDSTKRSTIYFEPRIHHALQAKAARTNRSVSDLVNEAVRQSMREDQEDLSAFKNRAVESTMGYETLLGDLKTHGKL